MAVDPKHEPQFEEERDEVWGVPVAGAVPAPRRVRSTLVLYILGITILICSGLTGLLLLAEVPSADGFLLSAVAAVVPALFYVWLAFWVDKREKEPTTLRLGAFLWGAGVAVLLAAVLNTVLGLVALAVAGPSLGSFWSTVIEAPVVEETLKWSALLILFFVLRDEFDSVLDGILYGTLVGLGFAMSENVLYFGRAYLEGGTSLLGQTFLLRSVYGGLGHALYTGLAGAGLGYAREIRRRPALGASVAVAALVAAIVQHSAWNLVAGTLVPSVLPGDVTETTYFFLLAPLLSMVLLGPGLLLMGVIAYSGLRREAAIIRQHLREEVIAGVVTPEEYWILPSTRRRLHSRLATLSERGFGAWHALGELYQTETELAFQKWRDAMGENNVCHRRRCSADEYREAIAATRRRLEGEREPD